MMSHRGVRIVILSMVLSIVTSAAPALAGGGDVLPPSQQPYGFSLTDMAGITAIFNSGRRNTPPPITPFQILYLNLDNLDDPNNTVFHVSRGTVLYVPVVFYTDSPPVPDDFPNLSNEHDVRSFMFDKHRFGLKVAEIDVDKHRNHLGPDYIAAVTTAQPLQDGVPGGHHYIVVAAFLKPLTKGKHFVTIRAYADGPDAFGLPPFELTYTVIVH
jgi:hypothetical protein